MNARVRTVPVRAGSASAARWVAEVPASAHRSSAVPTATAVAPAASAAATSASVPMPPAATTGRSTAARTAATRSGSGTSGTGSRGVSVPECPPAAADWTTSASRPASAAALASAAEVTVWTSTAPVARSAARSAAGGMPKVKLTTPTGCARSTSILSCQPSGSPGGSSTGVAGSVIPYRSASGASTRAYERNSARSTGSGLGANRFTPNGTPSTAAISPATASGVL